MAMAATPLTARTCEHCKKDITGKRSNARFCDRTCKTAGWHELNRATAEGKNFERARNKARYEQEAHKRRAYALSQYEREREYRQQYSREWRRDNPHRRRDQADLRAWRMVDNPGFVPFGKEEWERLLRRFDHRCAYCGHRASVLEKDHVVPLSRGGRHAIANILPACKPCNGSKSSHLLFEWRLLQERR